MKALLIDGLNLVRRIYAAVPNVRDSNGDKVSGDNSDSHSDSTSDSDSTSNSHSNSTNNVTDNATADHIGAVTQSTAASLTRALAKHQPSHCVAVFEDDAPTWRHQLFAEYKQNRKPMPRDLRDHLDEVQQAFRQLAIECYSLPGYEADDIIATLAVKIAAHGGNALIVSTDRHYCQLLDANIAVFDHFAKRRLDAAMIVKRFGVDANQLVDFLSLAGDRSANIAGIKTIGKYTAAQLLDKYGDLESVLQAADKLPGKLGAKLRRGKDDARLAKKLFTLKTDVELGLNLNQLRYTAPK